MDRVRGTKILADHQEFSCFVLNTSQDTIYIQISFDHYKQTRSPAPPFQRGVHTPDDLHGDTRFPRPDTVTFSQQVEEEKKDTFVEAQKTRSLA